MQQTYYVYLLYWPGGEVYVGCTKDIRGRIWRHRHDSLGRGYLPHHLHWREAGPPEVRVLETVEGREAAHAREAWWLRWFWEVDADRVLNAYVPPDNMVRGSGRSKRPGNLALTSGWITGSYLYADGPR